MYGGLTLDTQGWARLCGLSIQGAAYRIKENVGFSNRYVMKKNRKPYKKSEIYTSRTSLWLTEKTWMDIEKKAKEKKLSRSEIIRQAIVTGLGRI